MLNISNNYALSLFNVAPETITQMWQTVVLGMGMVFAVLALLWVILAIFGVAFGNKKKEKSTGDVVNAPVVKESVVPAQQNSDAELVAVITAAVAAYMASEQGTEVALEGFRVVSFKRVRNGRAWNAR